MDDGKRGADGKFESGHRYSLGRGRPAIPSDLKEARKLNREEVERVVNKYLDWPIKQLVAFVNDKDNTAPVFECLIASILAKAIQQGDHMRLDFVLGVLRLKPKPEDQGGDEKPNFHKQAVEFIAKKQLENGGKDEPKD